jgi:hypothetical protein
MALRPQVLTGARSAPRGPYRLNAASPQANGLAYWCPNIGYRTPDSAGRSPFAYTDDYKPFRYGGGAGHHPTGGYLNIANYEKNTSLWQAVNATSNTTHTIFCRSVQGVWPGYANIFVMMGWALGNNMWEFGWDGTSGGLLRYGYRRSGPTFEYTTCAALTLGNPTTEVALAAVRNGANVRIYRDTSYEDLTITNATTLYSSDEQFRLSSVVSIRDVRVYNRAITEAEMAEAVERPWALYQIPTSKVFSFPASTPSTAKAGIIKRPAQWAGETGQLNQASSQYSDLVFCVPFKDGRTADAVNGYVPTGQPKSREVRRGYLAYENDGSSGYNLTYPKEALGELSGEMTICSWVKVTRDLSSNRGLLCKWDGSTYNLWWDYDDQGVDSWCFWRQFSVSGLQYVGMGGITSDVWYWLAGVQKDNYLYLYKGDEAFGTLTSAQQGPYSGTTAGALTANVKIGSHGNDAVIWSGSAYDLRVYNRALNMAELYAIYRRGEDLYRPLSPRLTFDLPTNTNRVGRIVGWRPASGPERPSW